jgi:outer membrane immunogenic protein
MWEQDEYTWSPSMVTGSTGGEGWVGTAGVGCDYQVASRWTIGALAEYDFMNLSGYFKDPFLGYIGKQTGTEAWAFGGRIGYLLTPKVLAYINFGYSIARFDQINLLSSTYFYAAHTYAKGSFFFGAGTEYALADIIPLKGLFWRTEYRYDDDGPGGLPLLTTTGPSTSACSARCLELNKDVQTITSGLVWRFNGP